METVAINIPGSLYARIHDQFGEESTATIVQYLSQFAQSEAVPMPSYSEPPAQVPYPRPKPGTITGRVWEIADEISKRTGSAERDEVVKACIAEGINVNTASTQYSYWRKANPQSA
ncbi:MAG: hypothetical protein AB7V39_24985, partial [Nitrospiraceae bacterium]